MIYEFLSAILAISNICTVIYFLKRKHKQQKPNLDHTASDLLKDLLNGGAVAVVRVIDPSSIFLWSPKDKE